MSNMFGLPMPDTYKDVLTLTNNYQGLGTGLTAVQDAAGNSSPMQIALEAVNFSRADGNTFQLDGVALTASAADLNNASGENPVTFTNTVQIGPTGTPFLNIQCSMARHVTLLIQANSPYDVSANGDNIVALNQAFTVNSDFTVVLPDPTTQGRGQIFTVKDQTGSLTGSRRILVTPDASTVDGGASIAMTTPYQCISFYTDTVNWYTLSRN